MNDLFFLRLVFFMQPLALGAWFPRIPQVQQNIGLSEGGLALALMGLPIGLLVALSFGGKLAEYLGTRNLLTMGLTAYLLAMPLPAMATSGLALFGALIIAGVCMAVAQLGLNVTASEVEANSSKSIMNGCHGCWSVGVLLGSAVGAGMAELRLSPGLSLTIVAVASLFPLVFGARQISDYVLSGSEQTQKHSWRPSRDLLYISLFGFGIATTEGAMADWLAVFMTKIFDASPGLAGLSYTVFAMSVALGRFQGDTLKDRISTEKLARILVALACLGLVLTVGGYTIWVSFTGVMLLGFGVSLGFPLAVSAASVLKGRSSAGNVAILTQITLCGFLVGPPVIGLIAELTNLRMGLSALFLALTMAFAFAPALKPRSAS